MYEFNTEVNINLLENGNELPGSGKAMVKWVMTLEARDYGVKCFGLYVPEQKVKVDITCYDSETNEKFVVEKELDLKDVKIEELESKLTDKRSVFEIMTRKIVVSKPDDTIHAVEWPID